MFYRQKGLCNECKKPIDFRVDGSAHHILAHKGGGLTDDLNNAVLLHVRCHANLEKRIIKEKKNAQQKLKLH